MRDGDNVRTTKLLTKTSMKKGVSLKIDCLDGVERAVKIPPGSVDGDEIVLPRCGMPKSDTKEFGNLVVEVRTRPSKKAAA